MATLKTRQKIVSAFLDLLGTRGWSGFEMTDLAASAGVRLSVLRAEFPGKLACLEAFLSDIDQKVLDAVDPEMADQPARDRLFDVLMARLDQLGPHKAAVRAVRVASMRDPQLALRINRLATVSQRWMLTAAGLSASGPRAGLMAQGLVIAFSRVVEVWLDDEDPGLARTMSALDRQLDDGEVWLGRLDTVARMLKPLMARARSRPKARQPGAEPGEAASPPA